MKMVRMKMISISYDFLHMCLCVNIKEKLFCVFCLFSPVDLETRFFGDFMKGMKDHFKQSSKALAEKMLLKTLEKLRTGRLDFHSYGRSGCSI